LVAILRDGHALDQLHNEVGAPGANATGLALAAGLAFGRACIKDLGDIGMVHQRQRLPLRLEAGDDLLAVHARLDQLESDLAADGFQLLGHPDGAHAALADLFEQLVWADDCAGVFAELVVVCRVAIRWSTQEMPRGLMSPQQLLDACTQASVAPTSAIEKADQ